MDKRPFIQLSAPRIVNRPDLPPDLAEFYTRHEGVGVDSPADRTVRLCKLEEVARFGWKDLHSLFGDDTPEGWEGFAAFLIGIGISFEKIVYVLDAPSCPAGSIVAIGGLAPGPGGKGPAAMARSLVLATSFRDWLAYLERWEWVDYAIDGCGDLPEEQQQELERYLLALNPDMTL